MMNVDTPNTTYYPRVLVMSVNAFSMSGSNGKVLGQLFCEWPTDKIAQFYVYNEIPDMPVCRNYFRVTDKEAMKSFITGKKFGRHIAVFEKSGQNGKTTSLGAGNAKKPKKNPLTCLLRDLVWNSGRWKSRAFDDWLNAFQPEIIVLMAGGSSFMNNAAVDLSIKRKIPLVTFNTENYYFKKFNFLKGAGWGFLYPLYRAECVHAFRRLMKNSSYDIYGNDELQELYTNEFGKQSTVIYQSTSLNNVDIRAEQRTKTFTYTGNLGLNRHIALGEIATALQKISCDFVLDIYGKAPSKKVEEYLFSQNGIRFHGFVSYDEVKKIIKNSDLLFHAESFEQFRVRDLQTAFSTKISDSLASGRCFVLYADKSIACAKYLQKYDCACVITSQNELSYKLKEIINNGDLRRHYITNALAVAEKNHNAKRNSEKIHAILLSVLERTK
jgi:hypothetical protein